VNEADQKGGKRLRTTRITDAHLNANGGVRLGETWALNLIKWREIRNNSSVERYPTDRCNGIQSHR